MITIFLASFLIVYGIFALVLAFHMRPLPGWGWMLFDAIVTILLGILIWAHWPMNSEWVVGTLFGISIFVSGIHAPDDVTGDSAHSGRDGVEAAFGQLVWRGKT